jgi:hypothetical protein
MNRWAAYLAEIPPTLQRLIASARRVSLPRRCSPAERIIRLRQALCRARAVRETYFSLPPELQAAAQELRQIRRGLSPTDLQARFGLIRPLTELRTDRRPQSIAEHLLLLGWLLPRPATPHHPMRYLFPSELRTWLPKPIDDCTASEVASPISEAEGDWIIGSQPIAEPPTVWAMTAILVAAAQQPLSLRKDGQPAVAAIRRLEPLLPQFETTALKDLLGWLVPLLCDLELLAPYGTAVVPTPTARSFLARQPSEQLQLLQEAWIRMRRPDAWLRRLRVSTRGLDWPAFRRRLVTWAQAVPHKDINAMESAYFRLADAFGPLGDAHTHGLCGHDRSPWQDRGARTVWRAAVRGPLAWLGLAPQDSEQRGATDRHALVSWRYGSSGQLQVPPRSDPDLLDLAPAASNLILDGDWLHISLQLESLAAATLQGWAPALLRYLLERRAGPLPSDWSSLLHMAEPGRLLPRLVWFDPDPTGLHIALRRQSIRRRVEAQIAPGIALVAPGQEQALSRALQRAGYPLPIPASTTQHVVPDPLTVPDRTALLAAASFYRKFAPSDSPPGPSRRLISRLAEGLAPGIAEQLDRRWSFYQAEPMLSTFSETGRSRVGNLSDRHLQPRLDEQHPSRKQPGARSGSALPAVALITAAVSLLPIMLTSATSHNPAAWPSETTLKVLPVPGRTKRGTASAHYLTQLRNAIRRKREVTLYYKGVRDSTTVVRSVQPIRIERHTDRWYLHAYCAHAGAERCFRLDRIESLVTGTTDQPLNSKRVRRPPQRRTLKDPQHLRSGFFTDPPAPPSGSPLVRVWLEDES